MKRTATAALTGVAVLVIAGVGVGVAAGAEGPGPEPIHHQVATATADPSRSTSELSVDPLRPHATTHPSAAQHPAASRPTPSCTTESPTRHPRTDDSARIPARTTPRHADAPVHHASGGHAEDEPGGHEGDH